MQPFKVGLKIISTNFAKLKDVNRYQAFVLNKHTGKCKSIATIIAFATKNAEMECPVIFSDEPFATGCGSTFHQINGSDGFIGNGESIPLFYL